MRLPKGRLLTASAVALSLGVSVPAIMATSASAAPAVTSAAAAQSVTEPVTGTFTNAAGQGTFSGTFTPASFKVVNGALEAVGTLKGTLTDASGKSLGSVSQTASLPVQTTAASAAAAHGSAARAAALPAASCGVLNLVLGPLNLNLLGLVVTLNQVHLNITAVTGSLLGNLLCDVANLLNSGGALSSIASLLNQILAAL
jgi:hypothetical protein